MKRTLVLFEDEGFVNLLPLLFWRSVFELQVGRKLPLDRVAQRLGLPVSGVWTREWIAPVAAQRCGAPANQPVSDGAVLANGRWVCGEAIGQSPGEFAVLDVTGTATPAGRLEVHFRGGFWPPDPNAFIYSQLFVEADGGITGDYAECIYAVPDDFADFDDDGDEDLSDIAAFQNGVGLSGAGLEPGCIRAEWEDNWNSSGLDLQRPIFPAV